QYLSVLLFGVSCLFFAAFHFAVSYYDVAPNHVSRVLEDGQRYHLYGRVGDWPLLKPDRTEVKISLDSVNAGYTRPVRGAILLKISDTTTALQRGDRLEFEGRVYAIKGGTTPGGFDYRRYLELKGIYGIVYLTTLLDVRIDRGNRYGVLRQVDRLRDAIRDSFYRNLSPTAAALASGFLIGETRNIPTEIYNRFRDTGTMHLLAVSGSNVALVLLAVVFFLRPFSPSIYWRAAILLGVILVFTLLSYGEPSVVRASTMASLVILAGILQRRYDLNNIIAATALIILLINPAHLFNIGFQLSFITAWGLIYFTPRLGRLFEPRRSRRWYRWLVFPLLISVIAQVCSMPLIALYFHRLPVISVVANLVIVPLVSLSVIGIIGLLACDLILPLLGAFAGSLLDVLLRLIAVLLELFGGEHMPVLKAGAVSPILILVLYVFLVTAVAALQSLRVRRAVVIVLVAAANVFLVFHVAASLGRTSQAEVAVITIPGGVAALVQAPEKGDADLIVTGLSEKDYDIEERIIAPLLEASQVERLKSIFIVSAEYDAIDDLLRLAELYEARSVYVPTVLIATVEEVAKAGGQGRLIETIVSFQGSNAAGAGAGIYPSREGILLQFDSSAVLFCESITAD
ncbi:MAG: ComEC/Rec2 family competence protein, partial [Candidatus Zixiibacteriota bacterium]